MKTRAAIATAAGKPREGVTLDLAGPKAEIHDGSDLMHKGESIRSVVTY